MRRPVLVAIPLVCLPVVAAAQTAAPGAQPVSSVPAVAPPSATDPYAPVAAPAEVTEPDLFGIDRRAAEDPAADRAFAAPSALIAPRGTITVTGRAPLGPIALGEISVAIADRLELGVGNLFVADEDDFLTGHAKLQLWRNRRAALAASLVVVHENQSDGGENLYIPSLVASVCADGDPCRSLVSFHVTAPHVSGDDDLPIIPGVSFAIGTRTKLVGEAHLHRDDYGDGFIASYLGLRFVRERWAVDAGVGVWTELDAQPVYADCIDYCTEDTDADVTPWPFVGVSARL